MHLLFIICPEPVEDEVRGLLDRANVTGWTEMRHLVGRGATGLHLGTAVWPGNNSAYFCAVEDSDVERLTGVIRGFAAEIHRTSPHLGIRAFSLPCDAIV